MRSAATFGANEMFGIERRALYRFLDRQAIEGEG